MLVLIAVLVEDNFLLEGNGKGLLEDWNIFCMFAGFPVALLILCIVFDRFRVFVGDGEAFIDSKGAEDKRTELDEMYIRLRRIDTASGRWKLLRVVFLVAGFAWIAFNAYNRGFRTDEVYFGQFWNSSDYPVSYWVTNSYTVLVWG